MVGYRRGLWIFLVFVLLWGSTVPLAVPCCFPRVAVESAHDEGTAAASGGTCHEMVPSAAAGSHASKPSSESDPNPVDSHPCGMVCQVPALGVPSVVMPSPFGPRADWVGPSSSLPSLLLPLDLEHVPLA